MGENRIMKIIIDTDIGGDIDDALTLAMAVRSPEVELVGVTTVGRLPEQRAAIARSILTVCGRKDVPVASGSNAPLTGAWREDDLPNQYGGEMEPLVAVSDVRAEDMLMELVQRYPGEVTIIAIGAMTNLALAIRKFPSFKSQIKSIVLMGGAYAYHYREWNIVADPEAAEVVFDSGIPLIASGFEVSLKCSIPAEEAARHAESNRTPSSLLIAKLIRRWQAVGIQRPIVLFDVIPLTALIDPKLVKLEDRLVKVETAGKHTRGMTFTFETPLGERLPDKPNVKVCVDVDEKALMSLFMDRALR